METPREIWDRTSSLGCFGHMEGGTRFPSAAVTSATCGQTNPNPHLPNPSAYDENRHQVIKIYKKRIFPRGPSHSKTQNCKRQASPLSPLNPGRNYNFSWLLR